MIEQFKNIDTWEDKDEIFKSYYDEGYFLSKIIIQGIIGTKFILCFSAVQHEFVMGITEKYEINLDKNTKLYGLISNNSNLIITIQYEKKEEE